MTAGTVPLHLGACAYHTVREFYTAHRASDAMDRNCEAARDARGANVFVGHYFPEMVRAAVQEARRRLHDMPTVR